MTRIKVGHLNCHNNPEAIEEAISWGCHSLGLNEVGKVDVLGDPRADHLVQGTVDPERTSLSTRVLVRAEYENLGEIALLASPPSTPERIAPGRWLKVACYRKGEHDFAHVAFHNHAVVDDRSVMVDRVAAATRGFMLMQHTMLLLRGFDYRVVLTGDLNSRDRAESPDWPDPGEIFREIGFGYRNVGLDWVAWDKGALFMRDIEVIPREEVFSDHPGLVAYFQTT